MSVIVELFGSTVEMVGRFAEIALQGPVPGLLLLVGAVLVLGASAVFGVLTLGAVVDLLKPDSPGVTYPRDR